LESQADSGENGNDHRNLFLRLILILRQRTVKMEDQVCLNVHPKKPAKIKATINEEENSVIEGLLKRSKAKGKSMMKIILHWRVHPER